MRFYERKGYLLRQITMSAIMVITMTTTTPAETLLQPCPDSPNCVSSVAKDSHYIEPFAVQGDSMAAINRLRELLAGRNDTQLAKSDAETISVEFRTTLGFVDDAIFVLDRQANIINVRSASRSGYWDLGKNRRRLEEIRRDFQREGSSQN